MITIGETHCHFEHPICNSCFSPVQDEISSDISHLQKTTKPIFGMLKLRYFIIGSNYNFACIVKNSSQFLKK